MKYFALYRESTLQSPLFAGLKKKKNPHRWIFRKGETEQEARDTAPLAVIAHVIEISQDEYENCLHWSPPAGYP